MTTKNPTGPSPEPSDLLDVRELAQRLDVTEATVYRLTSEGKLPALRVGRLIRFEWASVLEAMAAEHGRRA